MDEFTYVLSLMYEIMVSGPANVLVLVIATLLGLLNEHYLLKRAVKQKYLIRGLPATTMEEAFDTAKNIGGYCGAFSPVLSVYLGHSPFLLPLVLAIVGVVVAFLWFVLVKGVFKAYGPEVVTYLIIGAIVNASATIAFYCLILIVYLLYLLV